MLKPLSYDHSVALCLMDCWSDNVFSNAALQFPSSSHVEGLGSLCTLTNMTGDSVLWITGLSMSVKLHVTAGFSSTSLND